MPLHLLGKKSWNVYNADNIERVKRDEAAARSAEEAEDARMQEEDAERRLAVLRGETPPPLVAEKKVELNASQIQDKKGRDDRHQSSKKRKRHGEDDTDFEMRVARERAEQSSVEVAPIQARPTADVKITDQRGHIDLIGPAPLPTSRNRAEKNPEAESERRQKERELEDQYTMRFSNAAGPHNLNGDGPWYAQEARRDATGAIVRVASAALPDKNVFGKDDPHRRERDTTRISAGDPLAMMKVGARRAREIEKQRKVDEEERKRAIQELDRDERRREKRRRRERHERDGAHAERRDSGRSRRHHSSERRDHRTHNRRRQDE